MAGRQPSHRLLREGTARSWSFSTPSLRSAPSSTSGCPAPHDDVFAISPDNRTIYYGAARAEADIWIVERTELIANR